MHILQIAKLTVSHGARLIFKDLNWEIGDHDRIGLVGANGVGKSTLFKAIMGEIEIDSGTITRMRGVRIGYLSQDVDLDAGHGATLWEQARFLPPELAENEKHLAKVEAQLNDPAVYENPGKLQRALERQEALLVEYERLNGFQHESRVKELLNRVGFTAADYKLPVATLSGGQKKLIRLVQLILDAPSILLLDEPDNHLDLEAKERLESLINDYPGTVIIISHDRYLLDEVVTQIALLEGGKLKIYPGNYTAYDNERALEKLRQQQQYVTQQKQIAAIQAAIARFELWADIAKSKKHMMQARKRHKQLAAMEERGEIIEKVTERRVMDLQLDGWRGSRKLLEIKNLAMGFDDDLLFDDLNLLIEHGDRIGVIGKNGTGKSVLFKLILGELQPLDGVIKMGPSARIGYYSQEHQTLADWLDRTPIERIRDLKPISEGEAVSFLGKFVFTYEHAQRPIRTLSGGERSRLQLAVLMLQSPNLLIFDEPTNNLDLPSVEALENALDDFQGALITISHDRYFMDKVVDRVVELNDGRLTPYIGGYTDYLEAKAGIKV